MVYVPQPTWVSQAKLQAKSLSRLGKASLSALAAESDPDQADWEFSSYEMRFCYDHSACLDR